MENTSFEDHLRGLIRSAVQMFIGSKPSYTNNEVTTFFNEVIEDCLKNRNLSNIVSTKDTKTTKSENIFRSRSRTKSKISRGAKTEEVNIHIEKNMVIGEHSINMKFSVALKRIDEFRNSYPRSTIEEFIQNNANKLGIKIDKKNQIAMKLYCVSIGILERYNLKKVVELNFYMNMGNYYNLACKIIRSIRSKGFKHEAEKAAINILSDWLSDSEVYAALKIKVSLNEDVFYGRCLVGTPDLIVTCRETGVIWGVAEVKTTACISSIDHSNLSKAKNQVSAYKYITKASHAFLIYISKTNHAEYSVAEIEHSMDFKEKLTNATNNIDRFHAAHTVLISEATAVKSGYGGSGVSSES